MPDNYPQSYQEARNQCPKNLLTFFDGELNKQAHVDLAPSDSPQGTLYLMSSIMLLGLPQLLMWATNNEKYTIRHQLYRDLVQLVQDKRRVELGAEHRCIHALEKDSISFTDLANCPVQMLRILLLPDFQDYLNQNRKEIYAQKIKLEDQISKAPESQREQLKNQKNAHLTFMEKFRNSNYSESMMKGLIREVRGNELDTKWKNLLSSQIILLKTYQKRMSQHSVEERQAYSDVGQVITHISLANEQYMQQFALAENPDQKMLAAQQFLTHCETAIELAKKHLNKKTHYTFFNLLADILNTVTLIATLGVSYWVTGKFRLFSPVNHNQLIVKELVDTTQQVIQFSHTKILELHTKEAEISLSL